MSVTFSRSVAGKRVVVTAGASGIGLAIAQAFQAEGAEVCIADVSSELLTAAAAAHPKIVTHRCDVGEPDQVAALFGQLSARWDGRLDVLVNNAGIAGPVAPIDRIEWQDWERTMRVNVGGMFLCIRHSIPLWQRNGGGAAINISSTSARTGLSQRLPYVVSKAAVHGLTLNVARELGPMNVSCNALLPGIVDNDRGRALIAAAAERDGVTYEQALADNLRFISMRTAIDPDEIAAMCLHLASPAGARISGQLIGVCGNCEWE
jgi:NAD(P)-dependent dehydrogenase (short-subunit alcohol dehydrogenase family)